MFSTDDFDIDQMWADFFSRFKGENALSDAEQADVKAQHTVRIENAIKESYAIQHIAKAREQGNEALEDLICPRYIKAIRENTIVVPIEGSDLQLVLPNLQADETNLNE